MARLNVVDPATASGPVKEIFDGPLKGKHFNLFKAMANSPAALNLYLSAAGALGKASLSGKEQEVVQLAIAEANGCGYCAAAHTAIGKSHGLTDAQTIAARKGRVEEDPKLDALARFATALHERRGYVTDADLEAFRSAGYNDGAIAEVIGVYALATYTNFFNHVNQTAVDFPAAPSL